MPNQHVFHFWNNRHAGPWLTWAACKQPLHMHAVAHVSCPRISAGSSTGALDAPSSTGQLAHSSPSTAIPAVNLAHQTAACTLVACTLVANSCSGRQTAMHWLANTNATPSVTSHLALAPESPGAPQASLAPPAPAHWPKLEQRGEVCTSPCNARNMCHSNHTAPASAPW